MHRLYFLGKYACGPTSIQMGIDHSLSHEVRQARLVSTIFLEETNPILMVKDKREGEILYPGGSGKLLGLLLIGPWRVTSNWALVY